MKFKKNLAIALTTLATLSGLGTSLVTTTFLVTNPLLTSPASAYTRPRTYPEAFQFLVKDSQSLNKVVENVWNWAGKGIASELIKNKINGRSTGRGTNAYNVNVNLGGVRIQNIRSAGANGVHATLLVTGNNTEFKSTTPCVKIPLLGCRGLGSYADPSFRVGFDMLVDLDLAASTNNIGINNLSVRFINADVRGSNLPGTLIETIGDFFTGGSISRDIVNDFNQEHLKTSLVTSLKDAINRFVPAISFVELRSPIINILKNNVGINDINVKQLKDQILRYGPDTCRQGYVWREARPGDVVCVTPEIRTQTANDNARAQERIQPGGGAYGPNTCRQGYVWREAYSGDVVCVTPETRTQAANDNARAQERKAANK